MINKEDTLGLLVSGTHGKLLSNLIGRICESYGIKFIQISKFSKNKKFSKIAVDDCLDTTAVKIVSLITSKSIKGLYTTKPYYESEFGNVIIKPFYFLLDKELTLYEDITGIKRNKKLVKNKISSLIDGLEKEHPELKSSIVNGSLKINYC